MPGTYSKWQGTKQRQSKLKEKTQHNMCRTSLYANKHKIHNKTWTLPETTGGKDEPNIVFNTEIVPMTRMWASRLRLSLINPLVVLIPQLWIIWLSNLSILSVTCECNSTNASCALNLILTLLFISPLCPFALYGFDVCFLYYCYDMNIIWKLISVIIQK
jgi:hypothetical protein